jgi:dynein heavy chain
LPLTEEPEVFGMHKNANIKYQQQESEKMIFIILNVQPRISVIAGGKSSDDIVYELSEELEANLPLILDKEDHAKDIFKPNNKGLLHCLSTVLL